MLDWEGRFEIAIWNWGNFHTKLPRACNGEMWYWGKNTGLVEKSNVWPLRCKIDFMLLKINQLIILLATNIEKLTKLDRRRMMRINKHSKIHCMFQMGLLPEQDPRRSKKHLIGWFKRFGLILTQDIPSLAQRKMKV